MKRTISLTIGCFLALTACTGANNLQASTDCRNVSPYDETANDGIYLIDSTVHEQTENTALVVGDPLIKYGDIESVELYPDEDNQLSIYFTIDFETGIKLSGIIQHHISEYMALVLDNRIVNVSQIQVAIGTRFILSRFDSNREAEQIYSRIKCNIK